VIALGGLVALIPFVSLMLLPIIIGAWHTAGQSFALASLCVAPLGYSYAIWRYNIVTIDRYLSRAAAGFVYAFCAFLLAWLIYATLSQAEPSTAAENPWPKVATIFCFVLAAPLLYRPIQWLVNVILHGSHVDHTQVIRDINQTTARVASTESAPVTLTRQLCAALKVSRYSLWLVEPLGESESPATADRTFRRVMPDLGDSQAVAIDHDVVKLPPSLALLFQDSHPYTVNELRTFLGSKLPGAKKSESVIEALFGADTCVVLPLFASQMCHGFAVLGPKQCDAAYTAVDFDMLTLFGRQASLLIDSYSLMQVTRARARDREDTLRRTQYAIEEERKRISRELHDLIIQSLLGVNYQINALLTATSERPETLQQVQSTLKQTIQETRRICGGLRPPSLDSLGFIGALRTHIVNIESRNNLEIDFAIIGREREDLPDAISLTILRVLQECIQNTLRHASASKMRVALLFDEDFVSIEITDDGLGCAHAPNLDQCVTSGHFGLVGLNERLQLLGGLLTINTRVGGGFAVVATVPISLECPVRAGR
jgi:signal transduction histidine kinase